MTASGNLLTYHPDVDYCGSDSVAYSIIDSNLATSNTGTINIILTCVNDAPNTLSDTIATTEDTPVWIPVLANDTDVE